MFELILSLNLFNLPFFSPILAFRLFEFIPSVLVVSSSIVGIFLIGVGFIATGLGFFDINPNSQGSDDDSEKSKEKTSTGGEKKALLYFCVAALSAVTGLFLVFYGGDLVSSLNITSIGASELEIVDLYAQVNSQADNLLWVNLSAENQRSAWDSMRFMFSAPNQLDDNVIWLDSFHYIPEEELEHLYTRAYNIIIELAKISLLEFNSPEAILSSSLSVEQHIQNQALELANSLCESYTTSSYSQTNFAGLYSYQVGSFNGGLPPEDAARAIWTAVKTPDSL